MCLSLYVVRGGWRVEVRQACHHYVLVSVKKKSSKKKKDEVKEIRTGIYLSEPFSTWHRYNFISEGV